MLPGLHRVNRGAEVAFEALGRSLASHPDDTVTLIGTGAPQPDVPYTFLPTRSASRRRFERWPKIPPFRTEFVYEEFTWMPSFLRRYRGSDYDVVVTCSYPFTNWAIRAGRRSRRPVNVFVTENGDWPATSHAREYRLFDCDGLVCTNPDYLERTRANWNSVLIPNGVDTGRFHPGEGDRPGLGLPADVPILLMVSALNPNKRVADGIRAVAGTPDAHLVVAGDGSLRDEIDQLAQSLLPGRFQRVSLPTERMPDLYRSVDAFLHMTHLESFGNVYIEAMATGLPIVAHASPVAEWIMGEHAQLVDTDDIPTVSAALAAALNGDWKSPVDTAGSVALRFDWQVIAGQYRDFFESILHARGRH